ncbi:hypothetical protein [Candidatus Thiodubiliella endoseptemdiera]|uniref:hypothetical protein n=1 Tax=Candidatus Thiodubiliella endoseptemdiera TaxID=2738886 RepID=UPI0034DDFBE2
MMKNRLTFVVAMTLAMGVIAGGDDRDMGPIESLEAMTPMTPVAPSSEASVGNQPTETLKLTVGGKAVSVTAHIVCQDKIGLKESNITIFRRAQAAGNLYNTGPIENSGTEFSPGRWDAYFECVARNGG